MNFFRTIYGMLRSLGQRSEVKSEIDEELRFHLEQRTAENIAAGLSPAAAAREARKRFGNVQSVREACRETRGVSFGEATWKDLRHGARMLRRNPGFATTAILTLMLGIGATSAVFSLIQGVLLTPPPYPKPEQVMLIKPARLDGEPYAKDCTTSQWLDWQTATNSFAAVAGFEWGFQYLVQEDGSQFVNLLAVTPDYFKVIGVEPLLGRAFSKADTAADGGAIIIGYELWQRQFHGDPNILGKVIQLSRQPLRTVVGVMPPGLRCLPTLANATEPNYDVNSRVDFWMPAAPPDLAQPDTEYLCMAGRLREGITPARAQAELRAIAGRQASQKASYQGITASVEPLASNLNRSGRHILLPLLGAVVLVLLIACANVTGLQLARGLQRQQEYAVRCALGARPAQLFRQVLTESLLLALAGGGLGVGLAVGILKVLKLMGAQAIPRLDAVSLGWPVVAGCFVLAILAALIAGLVPALHAAWWNRGGGFRGTRTSSAGRTERRWLGGLATVQIALTLALLTGAGLLIRTMINLAGVKPGYATDNILTMNVAPVAGLHTDQWWSRQPEMLTRVAALPGIRNAAFAWGVPLTGNEWLSPVQIKGRPETDAGTGKDLKDEMTIPLRSVSADYFNMLNLVLVAGRGFRLSDSWHGPGGNTNAPFVAVINQAMAGKYFAGEDPLGKTMWLSHYKTAQIIGVLADSRDGSLMREPEPEIYVDFFQLPAFTRRLVIRTVSDPQPFIGLVQRELRAVEPTIAIDHIETMTQIRADSIAAQTFAMRLLAGFSLVGAVLALVGIYGVLSLSVGSRKKEIAIRLAVGAPRRAVLGLVLSEGLKLIGAGLLLGTGLALVLARALRSFLFGVEPADPLTLAGVAILFTAVALLACLIPARRAAGIDPMTALRSE